MLSRNIDYIKYFYFSSALYLEYIFCGNQWCFYFSVFYDPLLVAFKTVLFLNKR